MDQSQFEPHRQKVRAIFRDANLGKMGFDDAAREIERLLENESISGANVEILYSGKLLLIGNAMQMLWTGEFVCDMYRMEDSPFDDEFQVEDYPLTDLGAYKRRYNDLN